MKQHTGILTVFREHSGRDTLTADLVIGTETHYWHTAPKCFVDAIEDGQDNRVEITVDLNDKMRNPRNVKVLRVVDPQTKLTVVAK